MSYVYHLALAATFLLLAVACMAQAKRATDGAAERKMRLAGTLFSVGAVAFFVAGMLSFATGAGR
jgi:hypothetical protein